MAKRRIIIFIFTINGSLLTNREMFSGGGGREREREK